MFIEKCKKSFHVHFGALLVLLFFNGLIFYNVLLSAPAVWTGEQTVVRDELVPFYDWRSQFIDQLTEPGPSELTQTEEVRVGYSFWTAWVRYAPILPIAIFLIAVATAFLLYLSSYVVLVARARLDTWVIAVVSLLTTLPVYSVILYSKFTHFYTLVLGFSLFALAASLCVRWVLLTEFSARRWWPIFVISFLVLINPAIHYHVIFYIFLMLLLCYVVIQNTSLREKLHTFVALSVVILLSFVPYALLILYITSLSEVDVTNSIPVNYQGIVSASSNILHILSFDIAGQTDMFLNGSYLVIEPRVSKLIWFGSLVFAFFAIKRIRTHQTLETFLLLVTVVALWMSIGYTYSFSFHSLLADFAVLIQHSFLNSFELLKKAISVMVQILRYPHRFLFIFYYCVTILSGVLAVSIIEYRCNHRKTITVLSALTLIVLLPFFFAQDLRSLFTGGNMHGFVSVTDVHHELRTLSDHMSDERSLSFILPTMESGREMVVDDQHLSFIDKFLIYSLDRPVFYYGSGAKPENKVLASLVYMSIVSGGDTWQYILSNSLNIEYVIYPKVAIRDKGFVYFGQIDSAILEGLQHSVAYEPVHETAHFLLFKRRDQMTANQKTLIDLNENNVSTFLQQYPLSMTDQLAFLTGKLSHEDINFVYTDQLATSYYNLFSIKFPKQTVYPENFLIPFSAKLVSSTYYNATPLSFEALLSSTNFYNFVGDSIFDIANLKSGTFVSKIEPGGLIEFVINGSVTNKNTYALVKASAESDELILTSESGAVEVYLDAINTENTSGFQWYVSREPIGASKTYAVETVDKSAALSVESLLLVPEENLFIESETGNRTTQIIFTETGTDNLYKLNQ